MASSAFGSSRVWMQTFAPGCSERAGYPGLRYATALRLKHIQWTNPTGLCQKNLERCKFRLTPDSTFHKNHQSGCTLEFSRKNFVRLCPCFADGIHSLSDSNIHWNSS